MTVPSKAWSSGIISVAPGTEPEHWLHRHTADEWLNAALNELKNARAAVGRHNLRGGAAGARRAAGMALNGALVKCPNDAWGRTYVEHITALTVDPHAPAEVVSAARALLSAQAQVEGVVTLQSPKTGEKIIEAARTVMAHAYAVVYGAVGRP